MAERNYLPQFMDRGRNYSETKNPPGANTNDIFGLEQRQREIKVVIYAERRMRNATAAGDQFQRKCHETEDIPSPRLSSNKSFRRSLSESRNNDTTYRTQPLATGKENIGSHFKKSLSPASKIRSEGKKLEESGDESDDETSPTKKRGRNPITGDDVNNSSTRSKQENSTSQTDVKNPEPVPLKTPRRPCIRVRQPPGGKSSIVF